LRHKLDIGRRGVNEQSRGCNTVVLAVVSISRSSIPAVERRATAAWRKREIVGEYLPPVSLHE